MNHYNQMSFRSRYFPHYKSTIALAIPVMFSQIGHMVVQITDNIMVGRVGTTSLAASSFAHNVFIGGLLFCVGFSVAMTPLVGAAKGAGDVREVGSWFKNGAIANMVFGVCVTVFMLGVSFFLDNMGQQPDVARLARPVYLLWVFSIVPIMVFQTFKQFAEGIGNTRIAALITVQEVVLNIGLNYLLIYGNLGFPALGVTGTGIATLVARTSMPITFALIVWRLKEFVPYRAAFAEAKRDTARILRYLRLGVPIAGTTILEVAAFAFGAIMMGWLGATELAAHQIAIGQAALTFMGATGIAAAATIRVSQFYGAHDRANMRSAGFAAVHIVLAYMSCTALAFVLLRHITPLAYTNDTAVIAAASGLLLIAALFQLFDGVQVATLGSLRGLADVKMPTVIAFLSYIVVALPTSYVTAFVLGWREIGIWTGYVAGLGFSSALFFVRFYLKSRTISFNKRSDAPIV